MPLAAGQTLSFYEILGPLGVGGMGEVYRARDTRLEREVAIKVLPEELADDEERLRRFEREARTLASLNHANVAQVFGIDQVDSTCFIVMELVAGEDLSERLARGALTLQDAVEVARQLAAGLEAAHEAGVVHRDLKPANVRITPERVVKILDFGLAKPTGPRLAPGSGSSVSVTAKPDSFLMTEEGVVLGTPTYMSPEQARAQAVDRRTDVWAFGCVLYECLTGERAFGGGTLGDVIAAVIGQEPDLTRLPAATPPRLRELLTRCLEKDARGRLRDMGEARVALERYGDAPEPTGAPVASPPRGLPRRTAAAGMALAALAGAVATWAALGSRGEASFSEPPAVRDADLLRRRRDPRGFAGRAPARLPVRARRYGSDLAQAARDRRRAGAHRWRRHLPAVLSRRHEHPLRSLGARRAEPLSPGSGGRRGAQGRRRRHGRLLVTGRDARRVPAPPQLRALRGGAPGRRPPLAGGA